MLSLLCLLLAAEPDYRKVAELDGLIVEARQVAGSSFAELRVVATTDAPPAAVCNAIFGDGTFNPNEPDLKARRVIQESEHERVTYDQISPPLVSDRDYAVRTRRFFDPDGRCRVTTEPANELAPKAADGWVRITRVRCRWLAEPLPDGRTRLTYEVHTDPAGSVPAFLVEGSRRKLAVHWVKLILGQAQKAVQAAPPRP